MHLFVDRSECSEKTMGKIRDPITPLVIGSIEVFQTSSPGREDYEMMSAVEKTYKPDSVPIKICSHSAEIISLGFGLPRTSSDLPEDLSRASWSPVLRKEPAVSSYLALHRTTLTVPVMSPSPRWALTPPFHPYLYLSDEIGIPSPWPSAVCSLWRRCRITPPGCYPASCP